MSKAAAVLLLLFALLLPASAAADVSGSRPPKVEARALRVALEEDLSGIASVVDVRSGRDYATLGKGAPLYRLRLSGPGADLVYLDAHGADERAVGSTEDGLVLTYRHRGEHPLEVECTVRPEGGTVRWGVSVRNDSNLAVVAIEYPLLACRLQLGDNADDDALLWPRLEGQIFAAPARHFPRGGEQRTTYPGLASAQLLYFYDPGGGLYQAAEDGGGRRKDLIVARRDDRLLLGFGHRFNNLSSETTAPGYDVVWALGGGRWEDAADTYRAWAERQSWWTPPLADRNVPDWLKRTNAFLNYDVGGLGEPAPLGPLQRYRDLLGVPVVAVPFGWERHGTWIGPDYFPPRGGERAYRRLADALEAMDGHLQFFTSGLRWGVRKPLKTAPGEPRAFSDYDGREEFRRRGRGMAVVERDDSLLFQRRPWAHNYILCVGSREARDLLVSHFRKIAGWGADGVDLDQNVGGGAYPCWSSEHGHPPGDGAWIHAAMANFLRRLRDEMRAVNPECFLGLEEPCEAYLPVIDIYHGRAFTATRWPVSGPGAVSVPLLSYLYHDRLPAYAGWCDWGFSPFRNVRIGLARAFLFGMQPGVRIGPGLFPLEPDVGDGDVRMLRQVARLMHRASDHLVLGRMLPAPELTGVARLPVPDRAQKRDPLPVTWAAVQATSWRAEDGSVAYAVANLTGDPQQVSLRVAPNGMRMRACDLTVLRWDSEGTLRKSVLVPRTVPLSLEPWEALVLVQRHAG